MSGFSFIKLVDLSTHRTIKRYRVSVEMLANALALIAKRNNN